jgi:diacylglycerol kinase family enzyme
MKSKVGVVYNPKSGSAPEPQALRAAFEKHDIEIVLWELNSTLDVARLASEAGCQVIVASGGDGTISTVAARLVGTPLILSILPAGTLNHFAKDLGIPTDMDEAIAVIARGHTSNVDVACVNGHYFLNNSSLGIYPHMVLQRESSRLSKWPAAALGLVKALARRRSYSLEITADGQTMTRTTPFVFIGNNSYQIDELGFNNRQSLTAGILSLYLIQSHSLLALSRLFIKALLGQARQADDFEAITAKSITIKLRQPTAAIACDGEVLPLSSPLQYDIKPRALKLIKPS